MAKNIISEQDYARFAQLTGLNEYNFSTGIREADDEPQQGAADPNAMGADPNMGGMGDPNAMGGMQDPNMGAMPPAPMGQAPDMGGMDMGGDPNAMMGDPMADPMGGMDMGMGGNDEVGPDDDVVDIDALTRAQQTTEYKIDDVSDRITTLERALEKFASATKDCGEKIDRVMSELERRVPTQEEQNARRMMNDPVYNNPTTVQQGNGEEQQEYVITTDDLKNINNAEVMKSVVDYPKKFNDFLDL